MLSGLVDSLWHILPSHRRQARAETSGCNGSIRGVWTDIDSMELNPSTDKYRYRPPVMSVMVVILVLTGMVLAWQLLLRPRIVPTSMIAGGTVRLADMPADRADAARKVIAAGGFLASLRQALPEHRALLQMWTSKNTRFSIDETTDGHAVLSYTGPGYAIRQFNFQAIKFETVGTQNAPSKSLSQHLIAKQEQLGEDLAEYVTREAKKVKSQVPRSGIKIPGANPGASIGARP